jgi:hypothetical protein
MEIEKKKAIVYLVSTRDIVNEIKYILQTTRYDLVAKFDQSEYMKHVLNELNDAFLDGDSRPIDHAMAHLMRMGAPECLARIISLYAINAVFDLVVCHLAIFSFREISTCQFDQHDDYSFAITIPAGLSA